MKHFILSEYLASFAQIIGTFRDSITYVDCFSGPWKTASEKYDDTSFAIALRELKKARAHKENTGGHLRLRAFFVEKSDAFTELQAYCDRRPPDGIEVVCRHDELENQITDIVRFIGAGGSSNFPFIFIDPTGWSGFSLKAITPLLCLKPGEVLVNFMTSHITRWVGHPDDEQRQVFEDLYGADRCARVIGRAKEAAGLDREDILVEEYMGALREVGGFKHMSAAVVLTPAADRTHFHLIYASRHPKGVDVFKAAEVRAMESMREQRSLVKDRKAETRDAQQGQFGLELGPPVPRIDEFYEELRRRYLRSARRRALRVLNQSPAGVEWDRLHAAALEVPLTFPADLKGWVRDWKNSGQVEVTGLKGKEWVPKSGSKIIWRQPVDLSPITISDFLLEDGPARLVPVLTISPQLEDEALLVADTQPFPFELQGSSREALREDFIAQLAAAIRRCASATELSAADVQLKALVDERLIR